jgi:hypothetical protein
MCIDGDHKQLSHPGERCPIGRREGRSNDLPVEHSHLVSKQADLNGQLVPDVANQKHQLKNLSEGKVEKREGHGYFRTPGPVQESPVQDAWTTFLAPSGVIPGVPLCLAFTCFLAALPGSLVVAPLSMVLSAACTPPCSALQAQFAQLPGDRSVEAVMCRECKWHGHRELLPEDTLGDQQYQEPNQEVADNDRHEARLGFKIVHLWVPRMSSEGFTLPICIHG